MKKVGGFFKKLFSFKKDDKLNVKKLVASLSALVLIIILIVVLVLLKANNQENTLNNKLKELGVDFYENFYYEQIGDSKEEREEFLKKFTEKGIKVNLDNLIRYNKDHEEELKKEFVNSKTEEACNLSNSKATIYPKKPYEKTDYEITVELDCGFDIDEKTKNE